MNEVTLLGTIQSEEIVLRHTKDQIPVTSFLLKVKRKKNYETNNNYDYITIVCWNKMAELVVNTYKAGMKVLVKGSINANKRKLKGYTVFKDGIELPDFQISSFEIYAQHVENFPV